MLTRRDGTKAEVDVRGWTNQTTAAAKDKWIKTFRITICSTWKSSAFRTASGVASNL